MKIICAAIASLFPSAVISERIVVSGTIEGGETVTIGNSSWSFLQSVTIDDGSNDLMVSAEPDLETSVDGWTVVDDQEAPEGRVESSESTYAWGLDRIDQDSNILDGRKYKPRRKGKGVDVYVLDTGIKTSHPEFKNRASSGISYYGSLTDVHGHGTHVASTITGKKVGSARRANVISVKVLSDSGRGSISDSIRGLAWVVEQAKKNPKRCAVVSMSLGSSLSGAMNDAADAVVREGIVVVVSSGNDARDAARYSPASAKNVITVGSTTKSGYMSSFSNYGDKVDILAPGSWIIGANAAGGYKVMSGTSMAAPHVSGVVAQIVQDLETNNVCPTPAEVKAELIRLATLDQLKGLGNKVNNVLLHTVRDNKWSPSPTQSPIPQAPTKGPTMSPTRRPTSFPTDVPCSVQCMSAVKKKICKGITWCNCRWYSGRKRCAQ